MKILWMIVAFVVLLIYPNLSSASCLPKTAIIYSNGMFNKFNDAEDSKVALEIYYMSTFPTELVEYDLAFARGDSQYPGIDALGQLLEAYALRFGDDTSDLWKLLGGRVTRAPISVYSNWLMPAMAVITGSALRAIFDHDMADHINTYKTYLGANYRVVIVAHSEGNLYANQEYDQLLTINPAWKQSLAIVSVATPAGRVADKNGQHFTVSEDLVINYIVRGALGSQNVLDVYCPPDDTAGEGASDFFGHDFVAHYLDGANSRDAILSNLTSRIQSLTYPGCTATPWKRVLTHEWSDFHYLNGIVTRVLRDDANKLQFHAAYKPPVIGAGNSGVVTIQVEDFDGALNSAMTPTFAPNGFMGFVPIPSGVGIVSVENNVSGSSCDLYRTSVGECLAGLAMELGDTAITLTSYVWDKAISSFSVSSQRQVAPEYQIQMYSDWTKMSSVVSVPSRIYRIVGKQFNYYAFDGGSYSAQYGANKSWSLLLGPYGGNGWSDYKEVLVIDVADGQLKLTSVEAANPWLKKDNPVDTPYGLYSSILKAIAEKDPASAMSGIPLWSPVHSLSPIPRSAYLFDQRILSGDGMPAPGKPQGTSPNFLDRDYMAGVLKTRQIVVGAGFPFTDQVVNQAGEATTMFPATVPWYVDLDVTAESQVFFGWTNPGIAR